MTRLHHVKHARKPIKSIGVKKGDSYYWWKFAYGAKQCSKEKPRRSALTQSDFTGQLWDAEDAFTAALDAATAGSDLQSAIDEAVSTLENLQSECADKISNMESAFPNGSPTIELVQGRADRCEEMIGELQGVEIPDDPDEADEADDTEPNEDFTTALDALREVDWSAD